MLGIRVGQDVLDQVVAVLVARNINERNSRTVNAALTDSVEVAAQELGTADLETFLHNLRGKLIHAVLGSIANDVVNGPTTVSRCAVFADVLNAPVAKLAVSNDINVGQNFFDAGTLDDSVSY